MSDDPTGFDPHATFEAAVQALDRATDSGTSPGMPTEAGVAQTQALLVIAHHLGELVGHFAGPAKNAAPPDHEHEIEQLRMQVEQLQHEAADKDQLLLQFHEAARTFVVGAGFHAH